MLCQCVYTWSCRQQKHLANYYGHYGSRSTFMVCDACKTHLESLPTHRANIANNLLWFEPVWSL